MKPPHANRSSPHSDGAGSKELASRAGAVCGPVRRVRLPGLTVAVGRPRANEGPGLAPSYFGRAQRNLDGLVLAVLCGFLLAAGCGPRHDADRNLAQVVAALERSYQSANPETQALAAAAGAALRAAEAAADQETRRHHYVALFEALDSLVVAVRPNPQQLAAINQVWQRAQQALQREPGLEDKRLYDAQAALSERMFQLEREAQGP